MGSAAISLVPVDDTIRMDDDPILRTVSQPVTDFAGAAVLIDAMIETLHRYGGRGLAAVQIGVALRVLIIRENGTYLAMINPTLDRTLNRFAVEREGCLSVPVPKWGDVSRPAKCDATWFDANGTKHSATLAGETARIFQHEFDHLNGVLMTDKIAA